MKKLFSFLKNHEEQISRWLITVVEVGTFIILVSRI